MPRIAKFVTKVCPYCNQEFQTKEKHGRTTCSNECANISWNRNPDGTSVRITRPCSICGTEFTDYPSNKKQHCNKKCASIANGIRLKGKTINSVLVTCTQCRNEFTTYASRRNRGENIFCSRTCYLVWHSTDRQSKEAREQLIISLCNSPKKKPNQLEIKIADWLHSQSLEFRYQIPLSVWAIDFQVGDTYIEVNGCYWHGCKSCFSPLTARQISHSNRDTTLQWYCFQQGITLLTIWEHDIEKGDFSALFGLIG